MKPIKTNPLDLAGLKHVKTAEERANEFAPVMVLHSVFCSNCQRNIEPPQGVKVAATDPVSLIAQADKLHIDAPKSQKLPACTAPQLFIEYGTALVQSTAQLITKP